MCQYFGDYFAALGWESRMAVRGGGSLVSHATEADGISAVGALTCTLGKRRDRETQSTHIHSNAQAAAFQERSIQIYKHNTGGPLHTACRCRRHHSCAHSPSAIATPHQNFLRHFVDFAQDDMFMWPPSAFLADPSSSLTRHPKWQVI